MIGPNLSEWALGKRSLVIFLMIVAVVAGTLSFLRLGRGEDPVFTFRTMVVAAGLARRDGRGDVAAGHRAPRAQAPGNEPSRYGA